MNYDVLIIGAGPGGIYSAYELTQRCPEKKVAVIEAGHALARRHCPIDGEKVKTCIGCKTCVVACPYGAMEVVVRPVIRHSGAGLNVVAEKAEANKCDLCFHRESGPACMEVCPTHALVCVDRNKLEQMNIEKRRRTALAW